MHMISRFIYLPHHVNHVYAFDSLSIKLPLNKQDGRIR